MKKGMTKVSRFVGVYTYNGIKGKCYYITYTVNGKSKLEKVGWDYDGYNATMAKHIRGERVRKIFHGKELPQGSKYHLTMGEAFNKYIEWAKANNKKSIQGDKSRYNNHLKPHMEHRLLSDIDARFIESKKKIWNQSLSPGSVKNVLTLLNKVYNKMIHLEYYDGKNPMDKVERIKANSNRERFLTQKEAKKLLNALKKKDKDLYVQACISLLSGLRKGEILNLYGRDIDLKNEILHVQETKDSSEVRGRKVNMSKRLKSILTEIDLRPHEKVFNSTKHFKLYTLNTVINSLKLNKGVEDDRKHKVSFHTLRHTFASWLAQSGESLLTIRELLGHKSIEMTMRYAHLIPDQKREAVNKLSDSFFES